MLLAGRAPKGTLGQQSCGTTFTTRQRLRLVELQLKNDYFTISRLSLEFWGRKGLRFTVTNERRCGMLRLDFMRLVEGRIRSFWLQGLRWWRILLFGASGRRVLDPLGGVLVTISRRAFELVRTRNILSLGSLSLTRLFRLNFVWTVLSFVLAFAFQLVRRRLVL